MLGVANEAVTLTLTNLPESSLGFLKPYDVYLAF